jgi:hypothetical protein
MNATKSTTKKKVVDKSLSIARQINEHHKLGHQCAKTALVHAVSCGKLLMKQKAQCAHGDFQEWVKAHCAFSYQSAALYMKAARSKVQGLDFSTLSDLYGTPRLPTPSGAVTKVTSVVAAVEPQPELKPQTVSIVMGKPKDDSLQRPPTTFQRRVASVSQKIQNHAEQAKVRMSDPIQEDCTSEEERWQHSATDFLGELLSMRACWAREFGEGWEQFEKPAALVTLAKQAAEELTTLAHILSTPTVYTRGGAVKAVAHHDALKALKKAGEQGEAR